MSVPCGDLTFSTVYVEVADFGDVPQPCVYPAGGTMGAADDFVKTPETADSVVTFSLAGGAMMPIADGAVVYAATKARGYLVYMRPQISHLA